ncbi:NGG1p interacting factor 3 protein, NIF3 [Rhodopirellula islandica]|uniref:GTP cyclohydrolase 1 type 2 homolog n=1 Tax=Rhodopirellula islandica TaxID=595434 RepID=A0A0J1BH92_RHOIS|nr:Nif3-like dinuclear metal center hexameric protein [Rhodopirellula islandica]KLU05897.1 NGG1p interacting factor 3 protein, NIF3 [Rhodopirellula islandica]
MSPTIESICQSLSSIAPLKLAEEWDNVGLLLGDRSAEAHRILTCLTITPAVVEEATELAANLIVAHHPLPFKPMSRITTDSAASAMVWNLCRAGIAVYSAHTAYDSAHKGINEQWANRLGLTSITPLTPSIEDHTVGTGRYGELPEPMTAREFLAFAAKSCGSTRPRLVGDFERPLRRVAIGCGSGGSFVGAARRRGCDVLLTGEATLHTCLEAKNTGLTMALVGHHASERFAMETLAEQLLREIQPLHETFAGNQDPSTPDPTGNWVRSSQREQDPIAVDPISLNP